MKETECGGHPSYLPGNVIIYNQNRLALRKEVLDEKIGGNKS